MSLIVDMKRSLTAALLLGLASLSWATPPLVDNLEYEGERNIVYPTGIPWLELLENEKTKEIRRQARCSAIGAPRAKWRIADNQLWLVGLFGCGGEIKLETVYGGNGEPIFAEWITSELVTQRGKELCEGNRYFGQSSVQETTVVFTVDHGLVTNVMQFSNVKNPAVPSAEDMQKIFGPYKDLEKEWGPPGQWPCLDSSMQRRARGTPIPSASPTGTTFEEYLREDAKKKMGQ